MKKHGLTKQEKKAEYKKRKNRRISREMKYAA